MNRDSVETAVLPPAEGLHLWEPPARPGDGDHLGQLFRDAGALRATRVRLLPTTYTFHEPLSLELTGWEDCVLDGNGARLVFSRPSDFIHVTLCRRVLLTNFTVAWDWSVCPLALPAIVTAVAPEGSTFDLRFPSVTSLPAGFRIRGLNPLDPGSLAQGVPGGKEIFEQSLGPDVVVTGERELRVPIRDLGSTAHLKPGQSYCVRMFLYDAHGITMADNLDLTLSHITVYGVPGHAFLTTGQQMRTHVHHCRLLPEPGSGHILSATADGFHVNNSCGHLVLEWNDFSRCGDDCLNIHTNSVAGILQVAENALRIQTAFSWRTPFAPGDPVEFRNGDLSPTGSTLAVDTVAWSTTDQSVVLTFRQPFPAQLGSDTVLFNRAYSSDYFLVRHNDFHHNRARGMLLQAGHGVVEHNRICRTQGAAIHIEAGVGPQWSEGYGVQDLVISDNNIENCDVNHWTMAVLYMGTYLPSGRSAYPIFSDISIRRNTIIQAPQMGVFLSSCEKVVVEHNQFSNLMSAAPKNDADNDSNGLPDRHTYQGCHMVTMATEVTIGRNSYFNLLPGRDDFVFVDPKTTKSVRIDDTLMTLPEVQLQ